MSSLSASAMPSRRRSLAIALGVPLGLALLVPAMLFAFVSPSLNSGASELPIAISGPSAAVQKLTDGLDGSQPDAFDFTTAASQDSVRELVFDREAVGGISIAADGAVEITVAGAAGTPYSGLLKGLAASLQQGGATVTVDDVAPLSEDDPNGAGLAALGLPLAFGGMISAVLLATQLKRRPWLKIASSIAASLTVGFAVTAVLQFGFGTLDGDYILTAFSLSLGVSAISLFILGLESLLGLAGIGIGAVLMMFIGNPLAGMATGWQWLPSPWGVIGQLLPIGASGTLVRSSAFFDGHGAAVPGAVLAVWAVVGILLIAVSAIRDRRAA